MSWEPDTDFDHAVMSMQPDHNYGFRQLQFEEQEKKFFTAPQRPQLTVKTSKHNKKGKSPTEIVEEEPRRSQIMQGKLKMMEKIQQITGTKPFGEHASLADWENTDNIEAESIAMMRHFGMMSMADGHIDEKTTLPITVPTTGVYIAHNGKRSFPLLLDTKYFEPKMVPRHCNNDNEKSSSSPSSNISIEKDSASNSKNFEPNSSFKEYYNDNEKSRSSASPNTSVDNSSTSSHYFSLKSSECSFNSSGENSSKKWHSKTSRKGKRFPSGRKYSEDASSTDESFKSVNLTEKSDRPFRN